MSQMLAARAISRRHFVQTIAGASVAAGGLRAASQKPNIVIILADDLGHGDLGVTGCRDIRTPNLDRMAAEGVRFMHAYSNGPVCSPTRTALLTGRYQQRAGVDRVIYAEERERGLSLDAVLLPEILSHEGYTSALIGKWHLGYPKRYFPTRQGFDEFLGFVAGNIDYFSHTDRLENYDLWRNEEDFHDPRYMTEMIADESIRFIDRHREKPFFLYVPFSAPHDPFQGPQHQHTAGDQHVTRRVNRTRDVYRSMVESLDDNIGRILKHLEEQNLEERTAVFFMSDNGGVRGVASNAPFRGYKGSLWEGGIRTSLIGRWKGKFPAGVTRTEMAAGMDLFPTALEIAGASLPRSQALDGRNLLPAMQGKGGLSRDKLFFHYKSPNSEAQYAMVQDGWKYLSDQRGHEYLFHLEQDIAEMNNLCYREPRRFARMKKDYQAWKSDVFRGAPPEPERPS